MCFKYFIAYYGKDFILLSEEMNPITINGQTKIYHIPMELKFNEVERIMLTVELK